jgi:dTDP-4-dehydrorhamnose reductase
VQREEKTTGPGSMQLWGGLESTIVRIGDSFRDEFVETGHRDRIEDLDRIAALGIRTLRYPVLWETVAPDHPDSCDWRFADERLGRLQELGIEPIVGLVHHGSGPRYTDLLDPGFAEGLARHAERVAARYPHLRHFTPVNEPLTTARFSGLYGHWYPHRQDEGSFLRMLANECRATVLAMQAIRRTTPGAQLVQTEDMGKIFATARLQYQADYENERRWLGFDLLCGRVDREHRFWRPLLDAGVSEAELGFFRDNPTPPNMIGVNHYLTSERYLDHHWWHYPDHFHGGNGRDRYADAEAVRIPELEELVGPEARLREVWERYGIPMAVTEAHHGCTGDEQVRWVLDVWDAACRLASDGVDLRAVTMWSLFGAVDWNTLLTENNGFYEPGAFDIRHDPPAETFLAEAARELADSGVCAGTNAVARGWWRRPDRFYQLPEVERHVS